MTRQKTDTRLNPAVAFLVKALLWPKVYYSGDSDAAAYYAGPAIFIVNHTSHLDGPLVTTALRRAKIHNLAAKDRFEQRGFGFILRHTGCIPIDRKNMDTSWLYEAVKVLGDRKESVAIFPEGRHGEHRKQLPFHPGAALLATMSGAPIVMVYVDGPVKFFRRHNALIVSQPFKLDPPEAGMTAAYLTDQTRKLEERMTSLMEEFIRMEENEE